MKRYLFLFFALALRFCPAALSQSVSSTWVADQGDGTYTNPIIHADYSDPDVCRAGDDFYMTASSFNCTPGLPILHSRDLVNWEIVGHALQNLEPADFFNQPRHGKGVWAPSIRYHNGLFYIFWGDPDYGIYMTHATDPCGQWSTPILVSAGKGMIDPTPLWDDDGRMYLVHAWAGSRAGFNSVLTICPLSDDGTRVTGQRVMVFDGNDGVNHTIEGPKLYKRNGYYYIFAPAGGVADGWQLVLRSKNIYGPYEKRIVMAQGTSTTNGPHQGGWVDTPSGESWFIHFQDKGLYGRVIHLQPMTWRDDWPIIGKATDCDTCGTPVMRHAKPHVASQGPITSPAEDDEFNSDTLGLQWQWSANRQPEFGFPTRQGFFRLYGYRLSSPTANLWEVPNLLLQKFPAPSFTATTKLKVAAKANAIGAQSGIVVMGLDYCCLAVDNVNDGFRLNQIICHDAEQGNKEEIIAIDSLPAHTYAAGAVPNKDIDIYLRVAVDEVGLCHFSYSLDNKIYHPVGRPFQAKQGKWIGAKVGLFSTTPPSADRGWVDIDWWHMQKHL